MPLSSPRRRNRVQADLPLHSELSAPRNDVELRVRFEYRPTNSLRTPERTARRYSKADIKSFAAAIREFGLISPIVIDGDGQIVAGQGRWEAAKLLDLAEVPTIAASYLPVSQLRAYRLADEKLASLGSWDRNALKIELSELKSVGIEIANLGFSARTLGNLFVPTRPAPKGSDENSQRPASLVGDVWELGDHRLVCGRPNAATIAATNRGDPVALVLVRSKWRSGIAEELMAAIHQECKSADLIGYSVRWHNLSDTISAGAKIHGDMADLVTWTRPEPDQQDGLYRNAAEYLICFRARPDQDTSTSTRKRLNRRGNVWSYTSTTVAQDKGLSGWPVPLLVDLMKERTRSPTRSLIIGSATTALLAATQAGRPCSIVEENPSLCDQAIREWEASTGLSAKRHSAGPKRQQVVARED